MKGTTKLYQLYDKTAQATGGPIMAEKHDAVAIRHFTAVLKNTETLPGKYPEHFELWCIGEENEETGLIVPNGEWADFDTGQKCILPRPPRVVLTGAAWKAQDENGA